MFSDIEKIEADYLGKWIEKEKELKDSDGKLSAAAVDINRIPGFSCNKIPSSKKVDLNILLKKSESTKEFGDEWIQGIEGLRPGRKDFSIELRQHYFLRISDINGFTDSYTFNNPKDRKVYTYNFKVLVVHKPINSNYWHFEFHIESDNTFHIIDSAKPNWRKIICSSIRDRVQEIAVFRTN